MKVKNIQTIMRQKKTDQCLKAYGGNPLQLLGMFEAEIEIGQNKLLSAIFYVTNEIGSVLLGRTTAIALKILKIGQDAYEINNISGNAKPFNKIKGNVVEIPIKADAKGVIKPYRRIPAPFEKIVDDQIKEMLGNGIIEEVKGVSRWVSLMVVVVTLFQRQEETFVSASICDVQMKQWKDRIILFQPLRISFLRWKKLNIFQRLTLSMLITRSK